MPFNVGPLELIIVLVIALLILGPGKLPEVGSSLGKSIREFRKAASDVQDVTKVDFSPMPATPAAPQAAPATPVAPQVAPVAESVAPVAPEPASTPAAEPVANVLTEQAAPNEIHAEPRA